MLSLSKCSVFKQEAQAVQPDYTPQTVTTDGWSPTRLAWAVLFPCAALILCFLHGYLSLRDRSRRMFTAAYRRVADKLWHCYNASGQATFSQRLRRLYEPVLSGVEASLPFS